MPLSPGHKLAHYDILEPIGKGGMGEVYRAKDSKLGRDVAIKVLPDEFSQDKERLARFKREAKVLASLNHPNIASIYGLEQSEGTHYLVLELVEGETLAERISRGPIPAGEALPLAIKIAEAVGAAHEQSIIHRDLKPPNIKLTPGAIVKILDFGLAKVFAEEAPDTDSSMSPTLTRNATRVGVILGTAAYMSPEQARGKHVDKRTDIWAYACVLYEMLTGRQAFVGEDVSETLARVIEREPNWSLLPAETHTLVRRLLHRCLEKDRTERIPDIGVARLEIKEALASPTTAIHPPASSRTKIVWTTLAVMLAVLAGLTGWNLARPERAPLPVTRTAILLGEDTRLANLVYPVEGSRLWNTPLALSQDGGTVYFIGERDGQRRIYRRALGQVEAEPIRGTEGSELVFLSPDGEWLGFSVRGQLKKMRLGEEAPVTFHTGRVDYAQWGPDNTVVFLENEGLWQIDSVGGEAKRITSDVPFWGPHSILPGGQAVLASAMSARIMLVPLATGQQEELTIGSAPQYVPSGHIVFLRGTSIWAIPFDLDRLEVTGSAVQVLEGVVERGLLPNYALGPSGSLIYVPAGSVAPAQQLVWVDRDGREEAVDLEPGSYRIPRLSRDGSRVVFDDCCHEADPPVADIWIYDLVSRNRTRLTFDPVAEAHPAWTPDGTRVAFFSVAPNAVSNGSIELKAAAGTGDVTRLVESTNPVPQAFSPDGQILIYSDARDIYMLQLEGDGTRRPLVATPALESGAYISPDGLWLAYASDESGRSEIYVRPFPNVDDGRWQVSTDGGAEAAWAHDGSELYYRNGDRMMGVAVDMTSTFSYGAPEVLFEGHYDTHRARNYDVARDGRFLMVKDVTPSDRASARQHLMLVQNWDEELERIFAEVE